MRFGGSFVAAAGLAAFACPAAAEDGDYAPVLRRVLIAAAAGTCPADVMAERLLTACRQQVAAMQANFARLGPIGSMTFVMTENRPLGRTESYRVKFAHGEQLWFIGGLADGKFQMIYSNSL